MTRNAPGIVLYHEYLDQIAMLTQEERGTLLTAILEYAKGGEKELTQEMNDKTSLVFSILRACAFKYLNLKTKQNKI